MRNRTSFAAIAIGVIGALLAPAAEAGRLDRFAEPPFETFVDASCADSVAPEGIRWSDGGGKLTALSFADGGKLRVGRHPELLTNPATGESVLLDLQGSVRARPADDELRVTMRGTNGLILSPATPAPATRTSRVSTCSRASCVRRSTRGSPSRSSSTKAPHGTSAPSCDACPGPAAGAPSRRRRRRASQRRTTCPEPTGDTRPRLASVKTALGMSVLGTIHLMQWVPGNLSTAEISDASRETREVGGIRRWADVDVAGEASVAVCVDRPAADQAPLSRRA